MKFITALILVAALSVAQAQTFNGSPVTPQFQPVQLLTAATVSSANTYWPGGAGVLTVNGTWNGATVTLQYVGADGSTLVNAGTACVFTANGNCVFYLPKALIKATITGAGGSTSLSAQAVALPNYPG